MPSALGAAEDGDLGNTTDNCEARCALTTKATRKRIEDCFAPHPRLMACPDDEPEKTEGRIKEFRCEDDPPCVTAAACLDKELPGARVSGFASIDLEVRSRGRPKPVSEPEGPTACVCDKSKGPCGIGCEETTCGALQPADARTFCDALGVASVAAFVEQAGERLPAPAIRTCQPGLTEPWRLEELSPRKTLAGVQISGRLPEGKDPEADPAAEYCLVFYADPFVVQAATPGTAIVGIPATTDDGDDDGLILTVDAVREALNGEAGGSGAAGAAGAAGESLSLKTCETTSVACHDDFDNDGDGSKDCADSECQSFCTPCDPSAPDAGDCTEPAASTLEDAGG